MPTPVKVLIVDDSALMRQLLTKILSSSPEIEVIGTAGDPFIAREKIKELNPDVLTLDVEMPRMDGLTFLEKLMRGHPMPVVMISSLTGKGAEITLRALALGAVDYIAKPKLNVSDSTLDMAGEIVSRVIAAARVKVRGITAPKAAAALPGCRISATHKVVAIGASTGGTEALKELLAPLPADFPGIVIVQHMPEAFTGAFAARARFALPHPGPAGEGRRPDPARPRAACPRRPPDGGRPPGDGVQRPCLPGESASTAICRRWTCCSPPVRAILERTSSASC